MIPKAGLILYSLDRSFCIDPRSVDSDEFLVIVISNGVGVP